MQQNERGTQQAVVLPLCQPLIPARRLANHCRVLLSRCLPPARLTLLLPLATAQLCRPFLHTGPSRSRLAPGSARCRNITHFAIRRLLMDLDCKSISGLACDVGLPGVSLSFLG